MSLSKLVSTLSNLRDRVMWVSIGLALGASAAWAHATPQEGVLGRLGFVQDKFVLEHCKAMASFQDEMKCIRQKSMDILVQEENKLRAQETELKNAQHTLSTEEFRKKRKDFEQNVQRIRQKTDIFKKEFQESYNHGLALIKEKLQDVIVSYAQKNAYQLVFNEESVIYGHPSDNLTPVILEHLDQALPNLQPSSLAAPSLKASSHESP